MSTKQQAMRAKKQAKRARAKKEKRTRAAISKHQVIRDIVGNDTIFDLINNREKLQRLADEGIGGSGKKIPELDRTKLISGFNSTAVIATQLHASAEVITVLESEKKVVLTEQDQELLVQLDKAVVALCEDIQAIKLLDQAGKKPEEYIDIVLHTSQLANDLMFELRPGMIALMDRYDAFVETYAKEHRSADMPMEVYMEQLHNRRIARVAPLYASAARVESDALMDNLVAEFEAMPDDEPVDESDNLPRDPVTLENDPVHLDTPQDPIHQ